MTHRHEGLGRVSHVNMHVDSVVWPCGTYEGRPRSGMHLKPPPTLAPVWHDVEKPCWSLGCSETRGVSSGCGEWQGLGGGCAAGRQQKCGGRLWWQDG